MNEQHGSLGTFSDELDRLRDYIDVRLREERDHNDQRQEETKDRLREQTALVAQQAATTVKSIDALNDTITSHNGRLKAVERALEYARGVKDGAGGSWHVLIGASGALVGLSGLGLAIFLALHK